MVGFKLRALKPLVNGQPALERQPVSHHGTARDDKIEPENGIGPLPALQGGAGALHHNGVEVRIPAANVAPGFPCKPKRDAGPVGKPPPAPARDLETVAEPVIVAVVAGADSGRGLGAP